MSEHAIGEQGTDPSLQAPKSYWEEEGLIWRGPRAPSLREAHKLGESWTVDDWMEMPHEHYIPISKYQLQEVLWDYDKVQQHRAQFKHLLVRMESIYHFHYHKLLNALKSDYEFFDPDKGERRRDNVSEEELKFRERRFLNNLMRTMARGNFVSFDHEFLEYAGKYDYLFDLNVHIEWNRHNPSLMEEYLEWVDSDDPDAVELREELEVDSLDDFLRSPPIYRENVLMFWRGIDKDRQEAARPLQKLDILISNLFGRLVFPVQRLIEVLRGERKLDKSLFTDVVKDVGNLANMLTFGLLEGLGEDEEDNENEKRSVVFDRRWIRRLNLQNQRLGIKDIFQPKTLQEPELEKVVAVFRARPKKELPAMLLEKIGLSKPSEEEEDPSIYIKMFKNIPLADSELVLPFKRPAIKSFDLTLLILTGFGGIFAMIRAINSKGTLAFALMAALLGLFVRLIMGYIRTLQKYNARMISELYDKNLDNDTGVLQYLIDSIEEQEYKEAMLAYYMLWLQGQPMREDDLDAAVESFLQQHFYGIEIDFEVDDALDKVLIKEDLSESHHIPLVQQFEHGGETWYQALPIDHALQVIEDRWASIDDERLSSFHSH